MVRCLPTLIFAFAVLAAGDASACAISRPPAIREAREVDAVFVGSVTNYRLGDPLAVEVKENISGEAQAKVTVLWRPGLNFGPPLKMKGEYLFAVDRMDGSASTYVVNQRHCEPALVFERGSFHANAVRELFGLWPEPAAAHQTRTEAAPVPVGPIAGLLILPLVLAAGVILLRGKKRKRADRSGL